MIKKFVIIFKVLYLLLIFNLELSKVSSIEGLKTMIKDVSVAVHSIYLHCDRTFNARK